MNVRAWTAWLVVGVLLPAIAQAQTGSITGTVTRADTSAPVVGVDVFVVGPGVFVAAPTNGTGVFTAGSLPAGAYRVLTSVSDLFVNEIFGDTPCVGSCFDEVAVGGGTPVAVTAGGTSAGIDFVLALSGRVSGSVVAASGGTPLAGAFVIVVAPDGQTVATGQVNGMGQYTVTYGMPTGTYYAHTSGSSGYLNEIYVDVVCPASCDGDDAAATGTPIPVTAGSTTTGIDFALARGATLAGRVTNQSTGLGVEGVQIGVFDQQGNALLGVSTSAMGDYLTPGLIAGTYHLVTFNDQGFIDELYGNVACVGQCSSVTAGTPVVVVSGQVVTGLDFALAIGGRIAGTVTAASNGAPLSSIGVQVYSSTGVPATDGSPDGNGDYLTAAGLPTGTYYLVAERSGDAYLDEIYDDVPCLDCSGVAAVKRGTPVTVTAGATTSGRNFQLTRGGTIAGRVVSAVSGTGVGGVQVRALTSDGAFGSANTDGTGNYTIIGLPAGQYVLHTLFGKGAGFVDEIFNNIPCVGNCDDNLVGFLGQPVTLASGGAVSAIDFALVPGGSASGTVTDAGTGAPLVGVTVHVATLHGGAFRQAGQITTSTSGTFTVSGLASGPYVAYTQNVQGYVDEMLGGLPCLDECEALAFLGTPFTVTSGATTGGLTFGLAGGGRISGTASDAGNGQPVDNAQVVVFDRSGHAVRFTSTAVNGTYAAAGLLPGTYYVAVAPAFPHRERAYGGVCVGPCDGAQTVAVGTPVVVAGAATTAAIDVPLAHGGLVSGSVTEQGTGILVPGAEVRVVDAQGRIAGQGFTGSSGNFVLRRGLAAGNYFAFTESETHADEIYDNVPCVGDCSASRAPGGTAIPVVVDATTSGRQFALAAPSGPPGSPSRPLLTLLPNGLAIQWGPPTTGGLPTSYAIDVGLSPGTTALSLPAPTTAYVVAGAPPGRFYVRVRALNAAGTGPASAEVVLGLGGGAMLPDAPRFPKAYMHGARLLMQWERNQFGGDATSYMVEAGTATGLTNIGRIPVTVPAFTYDGVPPGTYFLRVRAVSAAGVSEPSPDVMVVAGGATSPPGVPFAVGAVVSGAAGSISWSKPAGPVTGYVLEAGTAAGLSNAAVVTLGPQTSVAFAGIPPGRYFVRVRAVNTLGIGLASDEVTVVVQ